MKHLIWLAAPIVFLMSAVVNASSEVPLAWSDIRVETQKFGGAAAKASRTPEGHLGELSVSIRGRSLDISPKCLPNNLPVFLNDLSISYGEFSNHIPYWDLCFGVDFPESIDGLGRFHLILTQDGIHSSYIDYAESERVVASSEICAFVAQDP